MLALPFGEPTAAVKSVGAAGLSPHLDEFDERPKYELETQFVKLVAGCSPSS